MPKTETRPGAPVTPEAAALAESLVDDAMWVARAAARRCRKPWLADELEAGSMLWLVEAASGYDPVFGTEPASWCRWRVWCRAVSFVRRERLRAVVAIGPVELESKLHEDETRDPPLARWPADPLAAVAYDEATGRLGPRRKRLADLVLVAGHTPVEAGRLMGLSRGSAFRLWKDTLGRVRPHMVA